MKVDGEVYNLPRDELLKQSTVIRDMLADKSSGPDLGKDNSHPLELHGFSDEEFSTFLDVVYP